MSTVGAPGTQGAGITDGYGMGFGTRMAVAVAAATAGWPGDMYMPEGTRFTIGLWSMTLAAGGPPVRVLFNGNPLRVLGAITNVHIIFLGEVGARCSRRVGISTAGAPRVAVLATLPRPHAAAPGAT